MKSINKVNQDSLVVVGRCFLAIRICPCLIMLNFLLLLGDTVSICYITGAFLHSSVVEDLLSANVLLLESPQFFLLF